MKKITLLVLLLAATLPADIWNAPYPRHVLRDNVLLGSFQSPPRHLDPVVSYNSNEWQFLGQIYEPPFQFHYLKTPYTLEPLTLEAMPQVRYLDTDDREVAIDEAAVTEYRFRLRDDLRFQPHPCFVKDASGALFYRDLDDAQLAGIETPGDFARQATRPVTAADYVYAIKRMAVRQLHSPIVDTMMQYILGLKDYSKAASAAKDPIDYIRTHEIAGVTVHAMRDFTLRIHGTYPQLLSWMSMNFFAPIPWEAEDFYGQEPLQAKNLKLDTYPVGTGPYMMAQNMPYQQIVLQKNPHFRHELFPNVEGFHTDDAALMAQLRASAGRPIPFIDRVEYHLEKESVPLWNKFLQGYYDVSGVGSDSFDQAIAVTGAGDMQLTPAMREKRIHMATAVDPTIFYFAFNMVDPVVGGYDDTHQKLRRAISIAIDYEEYISIFRNRRGVAAQGPIPPGIFGFEPGKAGINPYVYRWQDGRAVRRSVAEAQALLAEAGYPQGRAPDGSPLTLYLDSSMTGPDAQAQLNWLRKQFAKLGIILEIRSTDYNRFQEKVRAGKEQMFMWGWNADYPDPENFLFLLAGENATIKVAGGGVNSANYERRAFDTLYRQIKRLPNSPKRLALIRKAVKLVRQDAPWIWGFHPKSLALYHDWYQNVHLNPIVNNGLKYKRLDADARYDAVRAWNRPVLWPFALLAASLLLGFWTLRRIYRRHLAATMRKGSHA